MSSTKTWATATDEQLRRAAAGVCGWPADLDGTGYHPDTWRPDTNRDQLARVFVAALAEIDEEEDQAVVYQNFWIDALTSPRAALAALLDLLQVPLPEVPHD